MFDFILEHHPGKKNPADVPSCQPDYTCEAVAKSMLRTLQEKLSHSVLSSGWENTPHKISPVLEAPLAHEQQEEPTGRSAASWHSFFL